MSVHVVSWVFKHSEATLGDRLVLLVLADHAKADGTGAWPSVATIAEQARMTERNARYCLRRLEQAGAIRRSGISYGKTFVYDVLMGEEAAPEDFAPAEGTGQTAPEKVSQIAPKPSKEPPRSSTTPNGAVEDPIQRMNEAVWSCYTGEYGNRYILTPERRKIIREALEVRGVEECCDAVRGLSHSQYHRDNGYADIRYALRGGGKKPSADATIDRMGAIGRGAISGTSDRATALSREHFEHARRLEGEGR
jgi:hypothetical protein